MEQKKVTKENSKSAFTVCFTYFFLCTRTRLHLFDATSTRTNAHNNIYLFNDESEKRKGWFCIWLTTLHWNIRWHRDREHFSSILYFCLSTWNVGCLIYIKKNPSRVINLKSESTDQMKLIEGEYWMRCEIFSFSFSAR